MLSIDLKKYAKFAITMAILGAIVFSYFCLNAFDSHQSGMQISDGTLVIFNSTSVCCSASFSKYVESIKSNLYIPERVSDYLMIIIASAVLAFVISTFSKTINRIYSLYKLYLRQRPDLFAFDPLKLAFSNGILNPKVF